MMSWRVAPTTALWNFLVPLGHDVLEGGSNNGSLELLGSLVPFLGNILLETLLVLPSVEDGPGDLTRITLQKMGLVGSSRQEPEVLAINLDQRSAMARVDLVARVDTQLYLHDGLFFSLVEVNQAILAW